MNNARRLIGTAHKEYRITATCHIRNPISPHRPRRKPDSRINQNHIRNRIAVGLLERRLLDASNSPTSAFERSRDPVHECCAALATPPPNHRHHSTPTSECLLDAVGQLPPLVGHMNQELLQCALILGGAYQRRSNRLHCMPLGNRIDTLHAWQNVWLRNSLGAIRRIARRVIRGNHIPSKPI